MGTPVKLQIAGAGWAMAALPSDYGNLVTAVRATADILSADINLDVTVWLAPGPMPATVPSAAPPGSQELAHFRAGPGSSVSATVSLSASGTGAYLLAEFADAGSDHVCFVDCT